MRPGRKHPKRGEIKETFGYPEPPENLDEVALAAWISVCEDLDSQGNLQKTDRKLLEIYSLTYALLMRTEERLHQEPLTLLAENGRAFINPLVNVQVTCVARLQQILRELRLTPITRSKGIASTKDAESEHFEQIIL